MSERPTISVVTPCFNSAQFIEATILCVMQQSYSPLEHIIVDGGSVDGTLEILQRYGHLNWISEPDHGQADALNKGFKRSRGEIIAWLNADDLYLPDTLDFVAFYFVTHPDVHVVYGEADWIDQNGRIVCHIPTRDFDLLAALQENPITQPAAFFRKSVLDAVGYLNTSYHYLMDYEFWLRVALHQQTKYVPRTLAKFRVTTGTKTQERAEMFALDYLRLLDDIFSHPNFPYELISHKPRLIARGHWHAGLAFYRLGQRETGWQHCRRALSDPDFVDHDHVWAVNNVVFAGAAHARPPVHRDWIDNLVSDIQACFSHQSQFMKSIKSHFYTTRAFYLYDHGEQRTAGPDLWRALRNNPAWLRNRGFAKRLLLSSTIYQFRNRVSGTA